MTEASDLFLRGLLEKFAFYGARFAKASMKKKGVSRHLQANIKILMFAAKLEAGIWIPHFWSWHVHKGRRLEGQPWQRRGPDLFWYKNPAEDPRLVDGKTPERVAQLRHFSRREPAGSPLSIERLMADRKAGKLEIRLRIGKPTEAKPFFDPGMRELGFPEFLDALAGREIAAYFRANPLPGFRGHGTMALRLR